MRLSNRHHGSAIGRARAQRSLRRRCGIQTGATDSERSLTSLELVSATRRMLRFRTVEPIEPAYRLAIAGELGHPGRAAGAAEPSRRLPRPVGVGGRRKQTQRRRMVAAAEPPHHSDTEAGDNDHRCCLSTQRGEGGDDEENENDRCRKTTHTCLPRLRRGSTTSFEGLRATGGGAGTKPRQRQQTAALARVGACRRNPSRGTLTRATSHTEQVFTHRHGAP